MDETTINNLNTNLKNANRFARRIIDNFDDYNLDWSLTYNKYLDITFIKVDFWRDNGPTDIPDFSTVVWTAGDLSHDAEESDDSIEYECNVIYDLLFAHTSNND